MGTFDTTFICCGRFRGIKGRDDVQPRALERKNESWAVDEDGKTLQPSPYQAHKRFLSVLNVLVDGPFLELSVESKDPAVAARILATILEKLDEDISRDRRAETQRQIAFLSESINSVDVVEVRQV